jgi:protoheme IX farnesyltransferase
MNTRFCHSERSEESLESFWKKFEIPRFARNDITLVKPRIALLSAASAAAGGLLAGSHIFWPVFGTFLLACAAASLNQIQERDLDARMERTRTRPLPAGTLSVRTASLVVVIFLTAGLAALAFTGNLLTVVLGVGAVLAYNAFYTPLKRRTAWASVVGAIVGAFAPLIGWTGAGGETAGPGLVALIVFLVAWQVPHFWLLFLRREHEFAEAGLPVLSARFGAAGLQRVTLIWTLAVTSLGLALPLFGVVEHIAALSALVVAALWLAVQAWRSTPRAFAAINAFAVVLLLSIIIEKWN